MAEVLVMKYQLQLWHGSWESVTKPEYEIELAAHKHFLRPARLWRVIDLTSMRVVAGEGYGIF